MSDVKGVIGISGSELARYAIFYESLMHVEIPPGTAVLQARGASIAVNRNNLAEQALKAGADWLWYVDDDQVFQSHTLKALLARMKTDSSVNIISGLYVQRNSPFIPQVYGEPEDELGRVSVTLLNQFDSGMKRCLATGAGCMLVKTKVFQALEPPYWRLGQIDKAGWCDDVDFCHRARKAGFDIWVDYDVQVGHLFNGTLWPVREANGEWGTTLIQGLDSIATWPAAKLRFEDGVSV